MNRDFHLLFQLVARVCYGVPVLNFLPYLIISRIDVSRLLMSTASFHA